MGLGELPLVAWLDLWEAVRRRGLGGLDQGLPLGRGGSTVGRGEAVATQRIVCRDLACVLRGRQEVSVVWWEHLRIAESQSIALIRVRSRLTRIPRLWKLVDRRQYLRRSLHCRTVRTRRRGPLGCVFNMHLIICRRPSQRLLGLWGLARCIGRRFRLHHCHERIHLLHGLRVHLP